jgi:hypothetical protein
MCKTCKAKRSGKGRSRVSGVGDVVANINWMQKGASAGGAIGGTILHAVIVEKVVPYINKKGDPKVTNLISGGIGLFMPEIGQMLGLENEYLETGLEAAGNVIFARSFANVSVDIAGKLGVTISGTGDDPNIASLPYIPTETYVSGYGDDPNVSGLDEQNGLSPRL